MGCIHMCIYHVQIYVYIMYVRCRLTFLKMLVSIFFSIKSGNECLCKTELLVEEPRDSALPWSGILGTFILFYYFFFPRGF